MGFLRQELSFLDKLRVRVWSAFRAELKELESMLAAIALEAG